MTFQTSELKAEQWQYLANLAVCGNPIPLSVARILTPLSSQLMETLISRCETLGWIKISVNQQIGLTSKLPDWLLYDLQLISTPERISTLLEIIQTRGLEEQLDKRVIIKLLIDTGKNIDASEKERELAHDVLSGGDHDQAYLYLRRTVERLSSHIAQGRKGSEALFIKSVLEFSNLSFAVGRGMQPLLTYLQSAVAVAESGGDERFQALGNFHLGRLEAYFGNEEKALQYLSTGKMIVDKLGDNDIFNAAAEFLGFYHTMHGSFDQAIIHFERAEQNYIQHEDQLLFYPVILWQLGLCLFLTGQVARSLGLLKNYWSLAESKGWSGIALITQAVLAMLLAVIRKRPAARLHLKAAEKASLESNNAYALFISRTGQAIQLFGEKRESEAHEYLKMAFENEKEATTAPMWAGPFFLGILAEFHHLGFTPVADGWQFEERLKNYLKSSQDPILFKAIFLRIRAENWLRNGEVTDRVREDLETSQLRLERAGFEYELNHTMIAFARYYRLQGKMEKAKSIAQQVSQKIDTMRLGHDVLPPDILSLLEIENREVKSAERFQSFIQRYFSLIHQLDEPEDEFNLVYTMLVGLLQLLGAERGAIFWQSTRKTPSLSFTSGCNLTRQETESDPFKPCFDLINRSFREKQLIIEHLTPGQNLPRAILVLPAYVRGEVRGAVYFENSFVEDLFDDIPAHLIKSISHHLTRFVQSHLKLVKMKGELSRLRLYKSGKFIEPEQEPIITQDRKMEKMLDEAQKAALSEATVLVTGETGTGKELLVNRIHVMSRCAEGPLIVVDATTIPENLAESELFGHEKGAFTGANQLKRGWIELAHKGTLFIDEIGELPLNAQAKLLRALETRKFSRVGGIQTLNSNFRLIAATHRNLEKEVLAGRFRQDLFYRLNVISCILPPLRERGQDIILIATHFLKKYCSQYGFSEMKFNAADETGMSIYSWPGNVRELKNVIERSVILSHGSTPAIDLPSASKVKDEELFDDLPEMDEMQRRYIQKVLNTTNGCIKGPNGAATILGMKRSTLYSRMYKLGMRTSKK